MNAIISKLTNDIEAVITQFTKNIAEKYELDAQELYNMWKEMDGDANMVVPSMVLPKIVIKPINEPSSEKTSPAKSITSSKSEGCPYLFTKGKQEGQICRCKPSNGRVYCSRHKKFEGTEPKVKKVLPTAKKAIADTVKQPAKTPVKKEIEIKLKKHKSLGYLYHIETGFAFKSAKERKVVGKIVNEKLVKLTEEDIDTVKSYRFDYEIEELTAVKKVTSVPDDLIKENSKKESDKKSFPTQEKPKGVKKSIAAALTETQEQGESVEEILGKLQKKRPDTLEDEDDDEEKESVKAESECEEFEEGDDEVSNYEEEDEIPEDDD